MVRYGALMKKIMIKVPGIQLKSFERSSPLPHEKESVRRASFSLVLEGGIVMNDVHIEMSGLMRPREENEIISHNDAMSDMRFCDYPIKHHGVRSPKFLLSDYVAIGMNEFLNEKHYKDVRAFLNRNTDSLSDSEFFKPAAWANILRIPVHFIRIYGVKGRYGTTRANIMIGHHISVSNVQVYPELKSEEVILDQRIVSEIKKLLNRKNVQERLGNYARTDTSDYSRADELFTAIPKCNREKIPPVRFY